MATLQMICDFLATSLETDLKEIFSNGLRGAVVKVQLPSATGLIFQPVEGKNMLFKESRFRFLVRFFVVVVVPSFILLLTLRKIQINFPSFSLRPLPSALVPCCLGIPKPAKYLQPVKQSKLVH